jgi:transcriptional regulator with XRE-family HTH domain
MTGGMLAAAPRKVTLLVAGGIALAPLVGTSPALGFPRDNVYSAQSTTQTGFSVSSAGMGSPADEIRVLQDEIRTRAHLTREQIARSVGVDRRSLSAWASGATLPSPGRVEALRFLARLVRDMDLRQPGRAHELLLAVHPGNRDALSAIADARFDVAERMVTLASGRQVVSVTATDHSRPTLWSAAASALLAGRLDRPGRSSVVRDSDSYEMDPAEAQLFAEDLEEAPRRRGYR